MLIFDNSESSGNARQSRGSLRISDAIKQSRRNPPGRIRRNSRFGRLQTAAGLDMMLSKSGLGVACVVIFHVTFDIYYWLGGV